MRNKYTRKGNKRSYFLFLLLILLALVTCFFFAKRYRDTHFVDRPKVYYFGQAHVERHANCLMKTFFNKYDPDCPLLFSDESTSGDRATEDSLSYSGSSYYELACGCEIYPHSMFDDQYSSLPPTGAKALSEAFDNFLIHYQDINYTISVQAVYSQLEIYRRLRKKVEKNPSLIVCVEGLAGYIDLTKKGRDILPSLHFLPDKVAYGADIAFDYWETADLLEDFDVDEIERKFTNREKKQLLMLCVPAAGPYAILYAQGIAERGLVIGLETQENINQRQELRRSGNKNHALERKLVEDDREHIATAIIKKMLDESEEEVAFLYGSLHNFRQYFPPREYDFQYASDPKINPERVKLRTFDDYFAYGLDVLRRRGWMAE